MKIKKKIIAAILTTALTLTSVFPSFASVKTKGDSFIENVMLSSKQGEITLQDYCTLVYRVTGALFSDEIVADVYSDYYTYMKEKWENTSTDTTDLTFKQWYAQQFDKNEDGSLYISDDVKNAIKYSTDNQINKTSYKFWKSYDLKNNPRLLTTGTLTTEQMQYAIDYIKNNQDNKAIVVTANIGNNGYYNNTCNVFVFDDFYAFVLRPTDFHPTQTYCSFEKSQSPAYDYFEMSAYNKNGEMCSFSHTFSSSMFPSLQNLVSADSWTGVKKSHLFGSFLYGDSYFTWCPYVEPYVSGSLMPTWWFEETRTSSMRSNSALGVPLSYGKTFIYKVYDTLSDLKIDIIKEPTYYVGAQYFDNVNNSNIITADEVNNSPTYNDVQNYVDSHDNIDESTIYNYINNYTYNYSDSGSGSDGSGSGGSGSSGGGILSFLDGIGSLLDLILNVLGKAISLVSNFFSVLVNSLDGLAQSFGGISQFIAASFSFIPDEIINIISLSFTAAFGIVLWRMFKK